MPFTYLQEPLLEMFKTVPPMQSLISLDKVLDWRFTDTGTLEQHNGSLPQRTHSRECHVTQVQAQMRNLLLSVVEMPPQMWGQEPPDSGICNEEVKTTQEAELGFIGFIFLF